MKKDTWIALLFSFLALLLRIPFMSRFLYHWDSVNYALSLERYDVRLHQPHPPGYFLTDDGQITRPGLFQMPILGHHQRSIWIVRYWSNIFNWVSLTREPVFLPPSLAYSASALV